MPQEDLDPVELFSAYMKVTGLPTLATETGPDPGLAGKKLGVINGASWTALWSNYFGRQFLPGVKLINVGNEAVQLNFMAAHSRGEPCPPQVNIDLFVQYAKQLDELYGVDAIIITCSTMNRAAGPVREVMAARGVPVVQIDEAMMEQAVAHGGKVLVVATHGPTVDNTRSLLTETAERLGRQVRFAGATVEQAFQLLGDGDIRGHNEVIATAIRQATGREEIGIVVLAQLSMTVLKLTYPDCVEEFGVDVLTSGETGFQRVAEVMRGVPK